MSEEKMIEKIVKEVMMSIDEKSANDTSKKTNNKISSTDVDSLKDYPFSKKRPELIRTPTDKSLKDITLEGILNDKITPEDIRIAPETLELQAKVAEEVGRNEFASNLRRAAELVSIPDDKILEIYNSLRPNRSTKEELLEIADELKNKYNAEVNSDFIKEAIEIYEKRDMLRKE